MCLQSTHCATLNGGEVLRLDDAKNAKLRAERAIGFEDVDFHIERAKESLLEAGAFKIEVDRLMRYSGWHLLGTARMGSDPKKSVLNQFLQAHDVDNLFVMDASSFVSGGCQNPTLTIMALAVRGCDHLMEEMKRGNI